MPSYSGGEPAALRTLERACAEAEQELEAVRREIESALADAGVADDASGSIRATGVDIRRAAALLGEEETRAPRSTVTVPPVGGFGRRLVNVPAARRDAPLVNVPAPLLGGNSINVPIPVVPEHLVTRPWPALQHAGRCPL